MKLYELYEEAARVVKMIEGTNLYIGNVIRCNGLGVVNPSFTQPAEEYTFALAIVEGKPVFKGDILYTFNGNKCTAVDIFQCDKMQVNTQKFGICGELINTLSWNKPKPKTVMVELLVGDAEFFCSSYRETPTKIRLAIACHKALKELE